MMPKMDGMQLCKKLKTDEKTSHIPIIMLTAKADSKSKIEGLEIGADDYIPKPFDLEELTARIRNLIENRKRLQEKFARQMLLKPKEIQAESMDDKFIKRITEIIDQHISDTTFGVELFAREAGMSVPQLYRKLNALTGFTPNDLIRDMRLQHAADLLKQRSGNVADAAYQSGFNNMSYFSKCFKDKFGSTPTEFIKKEVLPDRESI
jgi:AraC-like DNA-binding protein